MNTPGPVFSKGLDKAFSSLPKINTDITMDALKYKDMVEGEVEEKWSEKYKKSIDCSNPKGFSQKAHCQGKKNKSETKEATSTGGTGQFQAPFAFKDSEFVRKSFACLQLLQALLQTFLNYLY
jgi:hypothetical protein